MCESPDLLDVPRILNVKGRGITPFPLFCETSTQIDFFLIFENSSAITVYLFSILFGSALVSDHAVVWSLEIRSRMPRWRFNSCVLHESESADGSAPRGRVGDVLQACPR